MPRSPCRSDRRAVALALVVSAPLGVLAMLGLSAGSARAQTTQGSIGVGVEVGEQAREDLQLEVFLNGRSTGFVLSFTRHANGRFSCPAPQLRTIGLNVAAGEGDVFLDEIPELTFTYDPALQLMRMTAGAAAQRPVIIESGSPARAGMPVRPPLGAVLDYTLFASADDGYGGPRFSGASGAFTLRTFGRFGLLENGFTAITAGPRHVTRLGTTYSYEDPNRLQTLRAGDVINGALAWTRPLRLGGLQIQRSFGIRPDLVTLPLPVLAGTAAAPSSLDLYIDQVKTLSASVPQGPYAIANPPIVYGAGQARVVVRDVLGRETVTTSTFYASPQLLTPGLTDFSAELGFARRNYAILSNDYDRRLLFSASARRGLSDALTVQGHVEAGAGLALGGGGAVATVADMALVSVAGAVSRSAQGTGGLIDVGVEMRRPSLTLLLRSMRTLGPYTDLATQTATFGPVLAGDRRIFGAPREIDQFSISLPLRRFSGSVGVSFVNSKSARGDRFRVVNLSTTREIGRFSLFGSVVKDLETRGTLSAFFGLSMALGSRVSASTGGTAQGGRVSGYAEVSRQGANAPGGWGWSLRATNDRDRAAHAIVRHTTDFAAFEASALYAGDAAFGTLQAEGSLALVGGGLQATRRLDQSFAVVDAGAPGIEVYRENRLVGKTGPSGRLLVPDIAAFEPSTISIDPASLPVDARVGTTQAQAVTFTRVPQLIRFSIEAGDDALVGLVSESGAVVAVGAVVSRDGHDDTVVGYDGQVFLEDLAARNTLSVTTPEGDRCMARFAFRPSPGAQARLTNVVCATVAAEGEGT